MIDTKAYILVQRTARTHARTYQLPSRLSQCLNIFYKHIFINDIHDDNMQFDKSFLIGMNALIKHQIVCECVMKR